MSELDVAAALAAWRSPRAPELPPPPPRRRVRLTRRHVLGPAGRLVELSAEAAALAIARGFAVAA